MISNFVLIIGAMKSGTTTLYDYLRKHPQIATGLEKEPGFFAFEEKWALGIDWYESQFNYDPSQHAYALDASTDYTKHPFCKDVVWRLKASAPRRFKLIYIMRHPLRRIESHAWHVEHTKQEVGRCFSPRKTHSFDAGISPVSIAISRYAYQIDIFSECFEKDELLLLTLEQLAREPQVVLRRVCEFLAIESTILGQISLKSNVADSSLPQPLFKNLYRYWGALHRFAALRQFAKMVVPKSVRAHFYEIAKIQEGRFRLNKGEESGITAVLMPDLVRLRDRYGIDAEKEWGIPLQPIASDRTITGCRS
jgi:hypothetical protein